MDFFNRYILSRIKKNKNFLCCVTGPTGSGKSWSCLKEGEILDTDFDIRNVVFTPKEFLDLVNGKIKKLKPGSVILWDEFQVSMGSLDYHSLQAKCINYVLQTFRHKNFVLFISSPNFFFINASARKLFHSVFETLSIDKNVKQVVIKPLLLQVNQRKGNIYYKYLRVKQKGKGICPLKRIRVGIPSPKLLFDYEKKKNMFTKELNRDISKQFDRLQGTVKGGLTDIQQETLDMLKKGMIVEEIAVKRDRAKKVVHNAIFLMKKKGYRFDPVYKNLRITRYNVFEPKLEKKSEVLIEK